MLTNKKVRLFLDFFLPTLMAKNMTFKLESSLSSFFSKL